VQSRTQNRARPVLALRGALPRMCVRVCALGGVQELRDAHLGLPRAEGQRSGSSPERAHGNCGAAQSAGYEEEGSGGGDGGCVRRAGRGSAGVVASPRLSCLDRGEGSGTGCCGRAVLGVRAAHASERGDGKGCLQWEQGALVCPEVLNLRL
jgi:hypothetical protein